MEKNSIPVSSPTCTARVPRVESTVEDGAGHAPIIPAEWTLLPEVDGVWHVAKL